MFARVLALLPLAAFVVAQYQCNTGPVNCCDSTGVFGSAESKAKIASFGSLIGPIVAPIDAILGFHCSAIVGNNVCQQQPVCCEHNDYHGLVNVGCSPINIGA